MHTLILNTKKHGEVVVAHNGDWSGDVTVGWKKGDKDYAVRMPAEVFIQVSRGVAVEALRVSVISHIEEWEFVP